MSYLRCTKAIFALYYSREDAMYTNARRFCVKAGLVVTIFASVQVGAFTNPASSNENATLPCVVALFGDCFDSEIKKEQWDNVAYYKYDTYDDKPTIVALNKNGTALFAFYLSKPGPVVEKNIAYLKSIVNEK